MHSLLILTLYGYFDGCIIYRRLSNNIILKFDNKFCALTKIQNEAKDFLIKFFLHKTKLSKIEPKMSGNDEKTTRVSCFNGNKILDTP